MSDILIADLSTGNDYLILDAVQGPAGGSGLLTAPPVNSIIGPASANALWFQINEVTVTGGAVTVNFTASTAGSFLWLKILAGNPFTHNLTLVPPAGKMIEGILGAYNSGSPVVPGTYYSSITFQTASDVGSPLFLYTSTGGNIASLA